MTSVNLIPECVLVARTQRRHAKSWTMLILAAAGLSAVPLVLDWSRRTRAAELRDESGRLQQELGSTRLQLAATSAEATRVFLEVERANALRSKRAWSAMFALIASCLPADCWLASVATDPEAPAGGAPPRPVVANPGTSAGAPKGGGKREIVTIEAPRRLRMIGYAEDDTQPLAFVTNLKESRVFQNVLLERAVRAPDVAADPSGPSGGTVYQFEVVCEW
jgi:Tfp pilus assembly protein PilN